MKLPLIKSSGRVMSFDIENMPLTYYAKDYPTARITAIAWAFEDDAKNVQCRVITSLEDDMEYAMMLTDFLDAYNDADLVAGHYIRNHDLPIVNGALIEAGFVRGLGPKMTSDTKNDLVKFTDIPKNQEFLQELLDTKQKKVAISQYGWRQANRFTRDGIERTRKRVVSDVKGHMQVRKELINRSLLKGPKLWRP